MKKQVLLFTAIIFSMAAWGQTRIELAKTAMPPAIDGVIDAVWSNADTVGIWNIFPDNSPTVTATWRGLWNEDALYVLVDVEDDVVLPFSSHPEGDTKEFKYDKIEMYFDINDTLIDGQGPNSAAADEWALHSNGHTQSAPSTDAALYGMENTFEAADFRKVETAYSYQLSDKGYVYECKISWDKLLFPDGSSLDASMALNREIGFDVVVVDRDALDGGRQRVAWHWTGVGDEPWKNMDECGIIICRQDATGIADFSNHQTFRMFPNPAKQHFTLENAQNADFKLINTCGQVMIQKTIKSQCEVIGVSDLAAGIYLVSVDGSVQKLLVE